MEVTTDSIVDEEIQRVNEDTKAFKLINCSVILEKMIPLEEKKKRGRPKKILKKHEKTSIELFDNENLLNNQPIVLKRCRGRPKKNKMTPNSVETSNISNTPKNQKKTIKMVTETNKNKNNLEISMSEEIFSVDKNLTASNESVLNENACITYDMSQNSGDFKCNTLEPIIKCITNININTDTDTSHNDNEDICIESDPINWDIELPIQTDRRSKSVDNYTTKLQHRRNSLSDNFVYNFNKLKQKPEDVKLKKLWKSLSYLEGGPSINIERYKSYELNKKIRTNLKRSRSFPNCILLDTVTWKFLANQQSYEDSMLTDYEINLLNEMSDEPYRFYRSKSVPVYENEKKNYVNKSIDDLNISYYLNNRQIKSLPTNNIHNVINIKNCTKKIKNKIRRSKRLNNKMKCIDMLEEECFVKSDELKMQYLLLANQIQQETEDQLLKARENDPEFDRKLKKLNFTLITSNLFKSERNQAEIQESRKLKCSFINTDAYICNCKYSNNDWNEGKPACGSDCLNRSLNIECGPYCPLEKICTNRQFQNKQFKRVKIDRTPLKGYGVFALENIPSNTFINEYVGEVINQHEMMKRMESQLYKNNNYMVQLKYDEIIDATRKGNISRFINHSCDPNCTAEKWSVLGESRMGFISNKLIQIGEEITFDYSFETFGAESQKCFCGTSKCRGFINRKSKTGDQNSDENEYIDLGEKKNTTVYLKEIDRQLKEICLFKNKNNSDLESSTLNLNKFMVHITDSVSQSHILKFIRNNDLNCKKLFMNFNGLSIIQSWMVNCNDNESIKLDILQTLSVLPILDRNTITKSKVFDVVTEWSDIPSEIKKEIHKLEYPIDEFKDHKVRIDKLLPDENISPVINAARKLWKKWISLKMIFKIPKLIRTKDVNVVREPSDLKNPVQNHIIPEHFKTNSSKMFNYQNRLNNPVQNQLIPERFKTNFSKMFNYPNPLNNSVQNHIIPEHFKTNFSKMFNYPNPLNNSVQNHIIPEHFKTNFSKMFNYTNQLNNSVQNYKIPEYCLNFSTIMECKINQYRKDIAIKEQKNVKSSNHRDIPTLETTVKKSKWNHYGWIPLVYEIPTETETEYHSIPEIITPNKPSSVQISLNNLRTHENTYYEARYPSFKDQIAYMSTSVENENTNLINIKLDKTILVNATKNLLKQNLNNLQKPRNSNSLIDIINKSKKKYINRSPIKISQAFFKKNLMMSYINENISELHVNNLFKCLKIGSNFYQKQPSRIIEFNNYKHTILDENKNEENKEISKINDSSLPLKLCDLQLNNVFLDMKNKKSFVENQFINLNSENKFATKIICCKKYNFLPNKFALKQPLDNNILTLNPTEELELHQKLTPIVRNTMCLKFRNKNNNDSEEIPVFKQTLTMHYNEELKLPKSINKLRSDKSDSANDKKVCKRKLSSNLKYRKKIKSDKLINIEQPENNMNIINPEEPVNCESYKKKNLLENTIDNKMITQNPSTEIISSHSQSEANENKSSHRKTQNISMSKSKMKPFMKCSPFNKLHNTSDIEVEQNTNNSAIINSIVNNYNDSINKIKNTVRSNFANDPIVQDYIQRTKLNVLESKYQYELPESMKSLPVEVLNLLPDSKREMNIVINFYHSMATVIVKMLDPYVKKSCPQGRIKNKDDFKFLARKLNSNILYKELQFKNIENLRLSETVKSKVNNYIKKYMLKYGKYYKPRNTDE